jgi:hypothetical protein
MTPQEVTTRGPVTLRRWREDDLDAVFQAVTESLDHLRPWMPWAADYTRQSAAEFLGKSVRSWADGTEYGYAILAGSSASPRSDGVSSTSRRPPAPASGWSGGSPVR